MTDSKIADITEVVVETTIAAAPDVVWKALTEDIGLWWPEAAFGGGEEGKRTFRLEAEPGGRMWEDYEGGGGLVWGQVVSIEPGTKLQVTGHTFPEWGGPSLYFGTWTLTAEGDGCKLHFSDSAIGRSSEKVLADKKRGWAYLFDGAMKAHLEGRPEPEWEE